MKEEKIIFPNYYEDFKCRADLCSENCCLGWEIDIDGETFEKYKSLGGALGEKIRENTDISGGVSHFVMKNGRCPMLNKQNLCEIIISFGEGALCDICREHPRFYNPLSGVTLGGVGMSCEAAAELIIKQEYPSLYGDISPLLDKDDEDYDVSAIIGAALLEAESILCSDKISDSEKLVSALLCVKRAEDAISELCFGEEENRKEQFSWLREALDDRCFEPERISCIRERVLSLEFMADKLPKRIKSAEWKDVFEKWNGSSGFRRVILNCLGYLIARYLPRVFEEFLPSEFILSSVVTLCLLYSECDASIFDAISGDKNGKSELISDEIVRMAVLFSSEIEYSEENVEKLNIS